MCRMFMLRGNFSPDFKDIFMALQEVAVSDPYSQDVFGKIISHNDGWGFVSIGDNYISHYKSVEPVFNSQIPDINGNAIIVHVRKSGKAGPFGMVNAHPYYRTTSTHDIYLSHNGFLGKEEMGSKYGKEYVYSHSDSEIFLDKLVNYEGDPVSKIKQSLDFVYNNNALKGGINLFILAVNRKSGEKEMFVYMDALNFKLYHELYHINFEGYSGIFSSSLLTSKYFPKYTSKTMLQRKILYKMTANSLQEL